MNNFIAKLLLTIVFISVSAYSIYISSITNIYADDSVDEMDVDRNEQSTPRSFILPATPAVAEEQERKIVLGKKTVADLCMARLSQLGYQFDDLKPGFNAKFTEAIIHFQNVNNLPVSGELDAATRQKLGCIL